MFLNHDFCPPVPATPTERKAICLATNWLFIVSICFSFFSRFFPFFSRPPSSGLRNNRTRIHKNLFVAMVIQVVIRLTVYIDQAIIRSGGKKGNESSRQGIDNTVSKYGTTAADTGFGQIFKVQSTPHNCTILSGQIRLNTQQTLEHGRWRRVCNRPLQCRPLP